MIGDSWPDDAFDNNIFGPHQYFQHNSDKFSAGTNYTHTRKRGYFKLSIFPKAEGLTAMEAWVIGCIVFVFAALMEYTGILLKMKLRKLYSFRRKKDTYAITDLTFLVVFPFLFLLFNLLYWTAVHYTR